MAAEQPYIPRPGVSERAVVDEMVSNRESEHWKQCVAFVKKWVNIKASSLPWDSKEEVHQEVMGRISSHLPNFRFEGPLRAWVLQIISHCVVDEHRRIKHVASFQVLSLDKLIEDDPEGIEAKISKENSRSIEKSFERKEQMDEWVAALLAYANTRSNPVRNRQIIRMVLEEHTKAEIARAVGLSSADISYVINQAQRYAREHLDH
jgi:RNA polymerase sigma factor (sigma-70 family)